MKLILIVATDGNGAIGYKNRLPWKCANDMAHFRKVTTGERHGCVMGRLTWESLPSKKLPNRKCIVLSSTPIDDERCTVVSSLEEAKALGKLLKLTKLFVIGGARLFNESYTKCDELYITTINENAEKADVWFHPIIKPQLWRLQDSEMYPDCVINRFIKR